MSQVFYTKHQGGITAMVDGQMLVIDRSNPNFDQIQRDLAAKKYDRVVALANSKHAIAAAIEGAGADSKLRIKNGEIIWSGPRGEEKVGGPLVERIVASIRNGSTQEAIKPLIALLRNISLNKHKDLREEMYEFLMAGKMPITKDGCFLAYKKVRNNFFDQHSGRFDNSPGKLVVDDKTGDTNRGNECSSGLHFCARSYLSHYSAGSGARTVIVKVNPRHVFAFPRDYNCAKGRASEYYVVGEAMKDPHENELFLQPFIFDENLKDVAPDVKFVGEKANSKKQRKPLTAETALKPSLEAMAEGYGFAKNGKAFVRIADNKGYQLPLERYTIVYERKAGNDVEYISTVTGKPVPEDTVRELSIQTKSVRSALVRAVARRRNRG